eukprot:SAG11_NODE_278_length_11284_cov_202.732231_17_plen_111_part_00
MSGMTLAERRAALEAAYADNQATQTSKTPVDVGGVSLAQRKEDLEAFHNAMQQFSKLSLDLDFDLQDRLSKFGAHTQTLLLHGTTSLRFKHASVASSLQPCTRYLCAVLA